MTELQEVVSFNIGTHNGEITIQNPVTGNHRTFRIKTQPLDASFAPGQRIVSLLTGPNNQLDYKGFGFVKTNGFIILWTKNRTEIFEKYADMLTHPERYSSCRYMFAGTCRVCNRKLTNPESIESGIGPECAKRG